MRVALAYGCANIAADIPKENLIGVLEPNCLPALDGAVKSAIANPVGAWMPGSLYGKKVAIVVDDHTRCVPTKKMLHPLLIQLKSAGCPDRNITIIFASGTHRAVRTDEAEDILGREIFESYEVLSHNFRAGDLADVGTTKTYNNKISVNRHYYEADFKILTGDVELHYYAGYSGGRKSIVPGICSEAAIQRNHSMLFHPNARIGNLDGNPVHIDMVEGARLAGSNFAINVVNNADGGIVGAFAGSMESVLERGVGLVDRMCKVPISMKADVVVVGAGGYDIDFYQAYKAMHTAILALKKGGTLILAAECRDGYGNELFSECMQKYCRPADVEKAMESRFMLGAHKAYYLLKAISNFRVVVVTEMDDALVKRMRVEPALDLQTAVDDGIKARRGSKIYAIPHGGRTLPVMS